MNITIEQNNNIEWITPELIKKLYQIAINSNNTVSYSGYLKSDFGHGNKVQYLNNRFGPELKIEVQKYYLDIEDPEVERVLNKYVGDGVGVLVENISTSKFGAAFIDNTLITEFNEFRYFTQENIDPSSIQMFENCSNLRSITLADVSSVKINLRQFFGCTNLQTVNGLQNVTEIYGGAFCNCLNLSIEELNLPKLTFINSQAFQNHSKISKIINLGKISIIQDQAFRSNASLSPILSEVYLPYECTTIGFQAFFDCKNLTVVKQYTSSVDNWVSGEDPTSGPLSRVTNFGSGCFHSCSSLQLTNSDLVNATTIGEGAFCGTCFSGDLSLPNLNMEDLPPEVFKNCQGLTSVSNLGTITSIGKDFPSWRNVGTFQNCQNLVSVNLPSTLTILGSCTFNNCKKLSHITGLENITHTGAWVFSGHPVWNFVVNLKNYISFDYDSDGMFREDKKVGNYIKQIYMPKLETDSVDGYFANQTYTTGTFYGINTSILYLKNIQAFHPGAFSYTQITNLVINNTTPPEWRNTNNELNLADPAHDKQFVINVTTTINNIYVPDSAVSAYQNDSNWSVVASKIKPLSQLAKVATEADLQEGQVALIEEYM